MKKVLAIAFGLLVMTSPAFAQEGPNPFTSLAMHTIVSDDYLYCLDVCPATCEEIDNSALEEDVPPGGLGYAYLVIGAYNFSAITAVEFAIGGWPTVRGVPATPTMFYCPHDSALPLGAPFDGVGVAVGLGTTVENPPGECFRMFCCAYGTFNIYNLQSYWPLVLDFIPASYTMPVGCKVAGPPPGYVVDLVAATHGCTIGGMHYEPTPYQDCVDSPTAIEPTTWSGVKAMYH